MRTERIEQGGKPYLLHFVDKTTRVAKPVESEPVKAENSPAPKKRGRPKKHGPHAKTDA